MTRRYFLVDYKIKQIPTPRDPEVVVYTNGAPTESVLGEVIFEIEEDPLWIVSGKRRACIQLENSAATVSCRLRPVTAGIYYLQLH